jgi:hypothetical protein
MTKKKIATILIALGVVVLVALLMLQFLPRTVLLELTNGRLTRADYWSDEPVSLDGPAIKPS